MPKYAHKEALMAAIGTAERMAEDKAKIEDPASWPLWPVLPMKRRTDAGGYDLGLITPDFPATVLKTNLHAQDVVKMVVAQLDNEGHVPGMTSIGYASIHDMLVDGWTVD